ncbi:unnamed protein product [Cuscuta campestris]|uniref:Retrotransposon gag domain-containing protein n=1 Tax=Cuscuta campestris TaxID=132261 RepID=A0A484MQP4_9ASTE|nr:unnamed protein product [Cuscuta campestris]
MSHTSQNITKEDLVASNAELKAQVEYLAKQVAQLTKLKMSMVQTPEEGKDEQEEDVQSEVPSPTMRRNNQEKSSSDFKVEIPTFDGKDDPDYFIKWLETIERVFDYTEVLEDRKVKLVALKFRGYASTWWTNTTTKRKREGKVAVKTWTKMRTLLRKKFIPTHYIRENFARLQHLRQGNRSVEEYNREFEELLMRCDLQENDSQTFVTYLFGLNTQIPNTVELQTFENLEELTKNFGYSPYQDPDGDDYYEPHGDQDDYDQFGPMCDDQSDPLVEEIIRLEQKIFYFDELLFAEGSWYEPPYSRDYTLFAEEQIEANKVAIRERAKLLESVRKEKEFERRLCEGSDMMQKMLDDFQRERLEAEAKADKLVNDLCKAVELKHSLRSQDQMREINVQKEALEPKTNRATVVMLPEYRPSQVPTSIVVHEVEPTEGPDSEPPMLIQEKEEEVLPTAINDHLLNCVEDTPPEEPVLEEIEPTTYPQDSNVQESEEESIDEEILSTEEPITSIDNHASSEDLDQTFFDSLLDGCDLVCPKDSWSQKSWDELLVSNTEDSFMGESMFVIIKPQMDSQPIEDKKEINFTIKANDVDLLRRLPPPPTYTKSPPYILLPPWRREESRILDLDRAKIQTGWHQKRVRRTKLYDSRIGKSRKKWMPHRPSYPTVDRNEVQLIDAASRTRFDEWGHSRVLHESVCLAQDTLTDYGYAEEMEELLEGTRWQRLLQMRAESSLPLTIEFLCSISTIPEIESRQMTQTLITFDTTFAFTLAGQSFHLTVREMGVRLGIYTQEETEQPEFYDDPFCLPADFDAIAFWREHSSDDKEFVNKKSKARYWIRPSWRILSFVLSTSFFGRPSNTDRVYEEDMFVFWNLHDRQPVNVAVYLARFLYSQSYGCRMHLVCGFVITLLFRSLMGNAPIPRSV